MKLERERVHAVAVAGGRAEAVGEHVAEVRAAVGAAHLGAHHAERGVLDELDRLGAHRLVEARPAAAGVELRAALEELGAARRTGVDAGALLVEQLARPRALGARPRAAPRTARRRVRRATRRRSSSRCRTCASSRGIGISSSIVAGRRRGYGFVRRLQRTTDAPCSAGGTRRSCSACSRVAVPRMCSTGRASRRGLDGRWIWPQSAYPTGPTRPTSTSASCTCSRSRRAPGSSPALKAEAIRDEFGISATRYYRILGELIDSPAALRHDPMLVKRLQRMRSARAAKLAAVVPSRSADRSTERGPDTPIPGHMAQKFPRDRFDSIPHGIDRVGAHRAPARRGAKWIAFGWAALATVVLVAVGIGARHVAQRSAELRARPPRLRPLRRSSPPRRRSRPTCRSRC